MKVFITGASSGIGAALVRAYAALGAECALVARRADALETLRNSLPHPDAHRSYAVDVTDADALAAAAAHYMAARGVPDVVIAGAGISHGTDTGDPRDLAIFRRIVETNVIATVATFTPFIAAMKKAPVPDGGRRLVVIASVAGVRGIPGSGAYSASKAAAISYAESLRVELRDSPIRVVTIAPGFIDTPMTAGNPYRMPFLMPADRFAERAVRAIASGTSFIVIPWPMGWIARLLRILPNAVFDAVLARKGRKPRITHGE
jgi:NAD(P)-dependent dehydrogenase (short-subunit alcohol dehydrogenase family)